MGRAVTNYRSLKNRCPNCGHRKLRHDEEGCNVILGYGGVPNNDEKCKCLSKWVKK